MAQLCFLNCEFPMDGTTFARRSVAEADGARCVPFLPHGAGQSVRARHPKASGPSAFLAFRVSRRT